ncbi:MAG: hypothetical protein IKT79_00130 [Akkermansia sp.]|nr:hypothetical protein [Akkermansia sp.]
MSKGAELVAATPSMVDVQKLATSGQVFATAGEVANMVGYAVDTIISRLSECPTLGGRVYARRKELQMRYDVSANTMRDWLNTLEAEGVIHPIQGAPSNGAEGDTLYKIAEVDAALQERRRAYLARKEKTGKKGA